MEEKELMVLKSMVKAHAEFIRSASLHFGTLHKRIHGLEKGMQDLTLRLAEANAYVRGKNDR